MCNVNITNEHIYILIYEYNYILLYKYIIILYEYIIKLININIVNRLCVSKPNLMLSLRRNQQWINQSLRLKLREIEDFV